MENVNIPVRYTVIGLIAGLLGAGLSWLLGSDTRSTMVVGNDRMRRRRIAGVIKQSRGK